MRHAEPQPQQSIFSRASADLRQLVHLERDALMGSGLSNRSATMSR